MALARNSLMGLVPNVTGVVVSIVTVPLYITTVGAERYGALLIAFVMLGYFGQADFGLGRALTQRLSSMRDADPAEQAEVVWSGLAGAAMISVAGAALIVVAAWVFYESLFDAPGALRAEAQASVWLFALCIPVIMFTGVAAGALIGAERFLVVSLGTTVGNILSQILPLLIAVVHSADLGWLLAATLIGRVVGFAPIFVRMAQVFLVGHSIRPSLAQLRRLLSFGSWIMMTAIVGPLMSTADRLVIGNVIGAAAVVAYSVPAQIASRTVLFPSAIVQALFPRLASAEAEKSREISKSASVIVAQLYGFLVIGLICLAAPLLDLWLGDNLDERSILVGQISMIGWWTNSFANVAYSLIQARGNSRYTALLHLIELPFYGALLLGLGSWLDLYGVAIAFTVRCALDCVILLNKAGLLDFDLVLRLVGPAMLIAAAMLVSPWMSGWPEALTGASVLCTCLLALTWLQMPDDARLWIDHRLGRT